MTSAIANLDANWMQLVPSGEHGHVDERGAKRVLVIDPAAALAMEMKFARKVLVDQEHFSYDLDKSSEAYGWLVEVAARSDGIHGRIEWTDKGETAVANSRYRFLSPVFLPRDLQSLGDNRFRPLRIDSLGMTNKPNLPVKPLLNRHSGSSQPITQRAARPTLIANRAVPARLSNRSSVLTLAEVWSQLRRSTGGTVDQIWNDPESAPFLNRFANRAGAVESDPLWAEAARMEQDAYDRTWDMFASSSINDQAVDRGQNDYRHGLQPTRAFVAAIKALMKERKYQFKTPGGVPSGMDFAQAWEHLRETEPVFWLRHVFKMMHPLGNDR